MKEFSALSDRCKDVQTWLDYRVALICTVMANMWRDPKSKAFKVTDFMPGKKTERQTPKQMLAVMNAAYGGKTIKKEEA